MAKASAKNGQLPSANKRKPSCGSVDPQKKEKGRSRNACDRCKQKKVKCDGEGVRICSICREGDFQCNYAQKPHEEKRQYRKGYVEMVEEANEYYKKGLHELYKKFKDDAIFKNIRSNHRSGTEPTVQQIIGALGMASTNKPHEGGISSINAYLESQNKPMLVRRGEWDREEAGLGQQQPSPSPSEEMEMESATDCSSPAHDFLTMSPVKREFDAAFTGQPIMDYPTLATRIQANEILSSRMEPTMASQSQSSDSSGRRWMSDNSARSTPVSPLTPSGQTSQIPPQQLQPAQQSASSAFGNFENFFSHMQTCMPCADHHYGSNSAIPGGNFLASQQQNNLVFAEGDDSAALFFSQMQTDPTVCMADLEVFDNGSVSGGAAELHDLTATMEKSGHFGKQQGNAWFPPSQQPVNKVPRRSL